jgi:hypothetical protein
MRKSIVYVGAKPTAYSVCSQTSTALSLMKHETETIVGSWLLWLAGAAAKLLPIIQFLSFTAALVLSCIGIYKFFKHGEKK